MQTMATKPEADLRTNFGCWCVHWRDDAAHLHEIYVADEPAAASVQRVVLREMDKRGES